jgi:hypothetical protein
MLDYGRFCRRSKNNNNKSIKIISKKIKNPNSKHLMTGIAIFIAAIVLVLGTNIGAFADNVVDDVHVSAEQQFVDVKSTS